MKKRTIAFAVWVLLFTFTARSEEIMTNGFVFPVYQQGKVYYKSTEVIGGLLNYETLTKQMLFKQNNQVLSLGYPEATDSVVLGNRVFVYSKMREFFEKIPLGKGDLYVENSMKQVSEGRAVAYGGYSQVSNAQSLNSISTLDGGQTQSFTHLSENEKFKAVSETLFWVKKGDKFISVHSRKQVLKAFPEKKERIAEYIDHNKINFENIV